MTIRSATMADLGVLEELWRAFEAEVPPPSHVDLDVAQELAEIGETVGSGLAWVAEVDGAVVGMALARRTSPRLGRLTDLYVRPRARGHGVGTALVLAVARRFDSDGLEMLDLEVQVSNSPARALYQRWGLREDSVTLVVSVPVLADRLDPSAEAVSFGSIHVQTDDVDAVLRALEIYVPRLPGRSRGSVVTQPRGGYVSVYDDSCDRDPAMLRRLAKDISTRTGLVVIALGCEEEAVVRMLLFDRGSVVDEYASVPEYHGPLPPGEVIALQANPVVVERYTGATQAMVREAAPVAASPADLPPACELLTALGAALGLSGVEHGWSESLELDGAHRLDR
jgi:ribosomal protein S18 acetylase RimI-like enzyme